ncbi:hypothetical protein MMC16_000441 [Acarospora aff. strigata]|nr:hypothetical protein [Acarospora aff. strigata]
MCFSVDVHNDDVELRPRPVRHPRVYDDSGRHFDLSTSRLTGGYGATTRPERGRRSSADRTDPIQEIDDDLMRVYADPDQIVSIDQPASRAAGGTVLYSDPSRRGKEALRNEWGKPIFDEQSRNEYSRYKQLSDETRAAHTKYKQERKRRLVPDSGTDGLSKEANLDLIKPAEKWAASATA